MGRKTDIHRLNQLQAHAQTNFKQRKNLSALLHSKKPSSDEGVNLFSQMTAEQQSFIQILYDSLLSGDETLAAVDGLSPTELEVIYTRGYDAYQADNYTDALADFSFLVTHQPFDYRFHMAYASALQQTGQYQDALTFFVYAALLDADDPGAVFRAGECLLELKEVEAARESMKTCITLCQGQEAFLPLSKLAQAALDSLH